MLDPVKLETVKLDTVKQLITNQFEAAASTLNACIDACPESAWNGPVVNYKFCQAVFHTLFYADYYLGLTDEDFRKEPFHHENADVFRDYEELEPRPPAHLYEKPWIKTYLQYCRQRCHDVVGAETAESLMAKTKFPRKDFSRRAARLQHPASPTSCGPADHAAAIGFPGRRPLVSLRLEGGLNVATAPLTSEKNW